MGLTGWLARWAVRRPHLMLAVAPGATPVRLAVEAEMARMGAVPAVSPADADGLVVIGRPGPALAEAIDEVWRQLPGPRARVEITDPDDVRGGLRRAVAALSSGRGQATDAAGRADEWTVSGSDELGRQESHGSQRHDGEMRMPGGLMMADRGPDRDGLKLDTLRVPLGPVLPDWPGGLVVELTVQGDVVQRVASRVLPPAGVPMPFWRGETSGSRCAAARLDSLGRLLAVAGWPAMASRVRRLRDAVLAGEPPDRARPELAAVGRRLRRSVTLRWATDGLGVLTAERLRVGRPGSSAITGGGDVTARWRCWLDEAERLLSGAGCGERGPAAADLLAAAEELMVGVDVAAARLVLASFDPDPDELAATAGRIQAAS